MIDDNWRAEWEQRRGHFGEDARLHRSRLSRLLWAGAGSLAVVLGVVGVFLPVLPTTPFMILATGCFAKSSARLYDRLLSNRVFGPLIWRWQTTGTIPTPAKIAAIGLIVVTFTITLVFAVTSLGPRLILGAIGVGVIAWMLSVPTR